MAKQKTSATFDQLVKEINDFQKELHNTGKKAFQDGDYVRIKAIIETATKIDEIKTTLGKVGIEFNQLHADVSAHLKGSPAGTTRKTRTRLTRGKKTPENSYREPILKALVNLGGKAKTSEVLDNVYTQMKGKLNEFDEQPVPSLPSIPRWRHTAQIVRNKMVRDGHIMKNSSRGIWEISAAGRKALEKPENKPETKPAPKKAAPKKKTSSKKSVPKSPEKAAPAKKAPAKKAEEKPKETPNKTSAPKVDTKK